MGPKILYIASWGRSGSTLLDQVLGEAEGWFSCGELIEGWNDERCGCRARVSECELWGPVLAEVLDRHGLDRAEVAALRRRALGRDTGSALTAPIRARRRGSPARRYASFLTDLYRTVAEATGARVLIDSSKHPIDAHLISTQTELELYLAHLVRDPRANAYSWARPRPWDEPESFRPRFSPTLSSINWLRTHAGIELRLRPALAERCLRLRYEDFARQPRQIAASLADVADEPADLPFSDEATIQVNPKHMIAGNPARFRHGQIAIRSDDEWIERMTPRAKALATIPALPLLPRYGYPLRA